MAFYWKTKTFKTRELMLHWWNNNKYRYQMVEVFIDNGFALEYKSLKKL
jgi:hypothetical protein